MESCALNLLKSNYTHLGTPAEVQARFCQYLLTNEQTRTLLQDILRHNDDVKEQPRDSLEIESFSILQDDPVLGHMLLRYPLTLLALFEDAAVMAQKELKRRQGNHQQCDDNEWNGIFQQQQGPESMMQCRRLHIRLTHLPPYMDCCKSTISSIDASSVGRILQLSGTVVRTSPTVMMEYSRSYYCQECSHSFSVHADLGTPTQALEKPRACPNCHASSKKGSITAKPNGSIHADYQQVKIQESVERLKTGSFPQSMMLQLTHDLVDSCKPGDEVVVVGILQAQWPSTNLAINMECTITTSVLAHSIRVIHKLDHFAEWMSPPGGITTSEEAEPGRSANPRDKYPQEFESYWVDPKNKTNPIAARNFIVRAVCPQLYGLFGVKLGLLLTLIGGSAMSEFEGTSTRKKKRQKMSAEGEPEQFRISGQKKKERKTVDAVGWAATSESTSRKSAKNVVQTKRRAQSHILMVGDPGVGKSQLLKFAAALTPRSVLTTGTGCSSAGLTAAAVRDSSNGNSNEFTLEAGALVLADLGVCCIDEFGCIRDEDRTTIHEAMEQQTISVAKAGIVCKLNARATIVAVMNPRGGLYDLHESISKNTNLASPLLSRFDLIFVMLDTSSAERDAKIASFLLNHAIEPDTTQHDVPSNPDTISEEENDLQQQPHLHWSMDKLRAYIAIMKNKFHPTLSENAATLLQLHYENVRNNNACQLPITVRFLESLIRLSQAHARLMYRNTVTIQDAVAVILLLEQTAASTCVEKGYHFPMESDFSYNPDADFSHQQDTLLVRYGLKDNNGGPVVDNRAKNNNATVWDDNAQNTSPIAWAAATPDNGANNNNHTDCWGRTHQLTQQPRSFSQRPLDANSPSGGEKEDGP